MISPAGIRPPEWLLSLAVNYPERAISYAGITTHWMVVFLLVSIVSGYFASKVLGVEV